jgi:hypothetical protein
MCFFDIEKVSCPNKSDFYQNHVRGSQPVILKNLSKNWPARSRGLYNIIRLYTIDRGLNLLFKESWKQWKYRKAKQRAESSSSSLKRAI